MSAAARSVVTESPLLRAALYYAARGLPVFPLHAPDSAAPRGVNDKGEQTGGCSCRAAGCEHSGKHPRTQNGLLDASTDPAKIRQWWDLFPEANIGIRTGNGVVVLDVDPRHDGDATLERLEQVHGAIPDTPTVLTGSGGFHFYFRADGAVSCRNGLYGGLDRKGDGGYVVAPPSLHVSGEVYDWKNPGKDMAPVPEWVLASPNGTNGARSAAGPVEASVPAGARNATLASLAGSMRRRGMGEAEILAALRVTNAERCDPPLPEREVENIAASIAGYPAPGPAASVSSGSSPVAWSEPQPIPSGLPEVEPFSELLLPEAFRPWIMDIAERMQCPPDFPAVAAFVGLGSVVGRQLGIRPKRRDDWTVVPNLWAAVVGRPGVLKSPAVQEVMKPLVRLEIEAKGDYEDAIREWQAESEVRAVEKKVRADLLRKQLKKGVERSVLIHEFAEDEPDVEPRRRRYVVNDTTIEKLGEILEANTIGVLIHRDELTGFLRGLDKEGRESDRAFYLEAWNGAGRFTYDRIGRGTRDIEAACVSVLGTIQPGPLRDYLRGMKDGGGGDDGLLQRFQLTVWPDIDPEWVNVDRWPDREAKERAFALFARAARLDVEQAGAEHDGAGPDTSIPFLRFDEAAQEAFDAWRTRLEERIRSDDEHAAFESHLAKYRSLAPSLALLIHLADARVGPVTETAWFTAVAWTEYLESHARRIYAPVIGTDTTPAKALAARLRAGDLADGFTLREVYRPQWTGLKSKEDAESAVGTLEHVGWLCSEEVDTGGRPTVRYRINPRLGRDS